MNSLPNPAYLQKAMAPTSMIVIGGGLLGAAIAYGASRAGASVILLDQGDIAHRASRGNFGLVWVQAKGDSAPHYARWCRDAASRWPAMAQELMTLTGIDVVLRQHGGVHFCFSDAEMEARQALLKRIDQAAGGIPFSMLDRSDVRARLPGVGPSVVGASFCPLDGHANPLKLLLALHAGMKARGVCVMSGVDVAEIRHCEAQGGFEVRSTDGRTWQAPRVVVAAGLGTTRLAQQVGLHAPLSPIRGQMLITERLQPFLPYPTEGVRQTDEGSVQLGNSFESVGADAGTTVLEIEAIAKSAVAAFPRLSSARLIRAWACLRVLTPDSLPVYEESSSCPGAFVATSHSGVSLAALHAAVIGPWMAGLRDEPVEISAFAGSRFLDPARSYSNAFLDAFANAH